MPQQLILCGVLASILVDRSSIFGWFAFWRGGLFSILVYNLFLNNLRAHIVNGFFNYFIHPKNFHLASVLLT
jgi:hypothetical protein